MNLVMDDFYHAHSLRLLCVEECGNFVTSSQAGDYALTRTGDVTKTITGNVTESIENGSVTINNNLMGKTVTEMMPDGDYKTEVTAKNYETMFMINGEHKVMDMSLKSTKYVGGLLDVTYAQPRTINDINPFFEIFLGVKNGFVAGMSSDVKLCVTVDYRKSIHFFNENQSVIDTKISLRKCGQSIQKASQIVVLCSCLMLA